MKSLGRRERKMNKVNKNCSCYYLDKQSISMNSFMIRNLAMLRRVIMKVNMKV